jgi:hypothetical protein
MSLPLSFYKEVEGQQSCKRNFADLKDFPPATLQGKQRSELASPTANPAKGFTPAKATVWNRKSFRAAE